MSSKIKYKPGECYDYKLLIKHILEMPLHFAPDQEIVYRDKVRLTYRTLNERIHRLADGLERLGVKKGDTVCIFDYDSHRFLECFFAVPMMGAVLHTQNWRLSPEQITYTMNHAGDKVVLVHSELLPQLEAVWDKLKTVKTVIVMTDEDQKVTSTVPIKAEYEELLAKSKSFYDFPEFDERTRATTFYTTGTTGLPKGVYYSHRQLVLHTQSLLVLYGVYESVGRLRSTDVYMPITPMFHVHAWGIPYAATQLGIKQVYPGRYEPEMLLKLIDKEKVTYSHCVPTILQMILDTPSAKKTDLTSWKVIVGGSRLTKGLAIDFIHKGIEIYAGCGMSEAGPLVASATLKPWMLKQTKEEQADTLIKSGMPGPFVYIRLFDPVTGKEVPHDGVSTGEVCLRSPWLTESYHNDPERSKELWRDGWLHSGDIGHIDKEGYLQFTDRIKDVIKTGGEWISSLDLENILSQHEAVKEAAAIGIPDAKWGERPFMVVVLKPEFEGKIKGEVFREFIMEQAKAGKIPKYAVPNRIEIIDAIPKTSVGKVSKVELRKSYC